MTPRAPQLAPALAPEPGAGPSARSPRSRAVLGQLSDMDLRLLRIFKSVVECGGMSAAELELNISPSTLSRHMKDLEERLELVLCRRGRAGFALTPEGQLVYEATLQLLGGVDVFRGRVDEIHDRMGGMLELAVFDKTATNPQAHIAQAIREFRSIAPAVNLQLHVCSINTIERGLMDGRFQVGIIPAHRASASLEYHDLFGERMQLYCASGHPLFGADHSTVGWAEVRSYDFAGLGYHSPNMELSHSARLPRKATGFDQEAIATLILSGCFVGFLPDHYARAMVEEGRLQAIAPERLHYDCRFVAMWRLSPAPTRVAQAFMACLERAHAASSLAPAPAPAGVG